MSCAQRIDFDTFGAQGPLTRGATRCHSVDKQGGVSKSMVTVGGRGGVECTCGVSVIKPLPRVQATLPGLPNGGIGLDECRSDARAVSRYQPACCNRLCRRAAYRYQPARCSSNGCALATTSARRLIPGIHSLPSEIKNTPNTLHTKPRQACTRPHLVYTPIVLKQPPPKR